eukprot:g4526.t1
MESKVKVEKECDFDGRAIPCPGASNDLAPLAACFDSGGPQHSLVYTGLQGAGPHLAFLTAKVHFSVNADHKSESATGPMEVGADGRVYAAVQYPSLKDLWPEIYHNRGVRVVQVDVFVEVQSGSTSLRYPGTEFKVTYQREKTPADNVVLWRPQDVLHTIRR